MVTKDTVTLPEAALKQLLEDAATAGAKKALSAVGLHDEEASADVHELRGLLDAWRAAKSTAWTTLISWTIKAFLAAIIASLGMLVWSKH